jgi:hypothetical protein
MKERVAKGWLRSIERLNVVASDLKPQIDRRIATGRPLQQIRCLIPGFDGAIHSVEWKEALWDNFFSAAPERQKQSVEQHNIVKRA